MTIKPYPFDQLKRFTADEAAFLSSVARLLPSEGSSALFNDIKALFTQYVGIPVEAHYESFYQTTFKRYLAGLPKRLVALAVSLTPHPEKVIIEADFDLSLQIIDRVLGGSGENNRTTQVITALDEGVLQFFAVRTLKELSRFLASSSTGLQFGQIYSDVVAVSALYPEEERMFFLTFRVSLDGQIGSLRMGFPASLLAGLQRQGVVFRDDEDLLNADGDERFGKFLHSRTVLWAEMGKLTLTVDEVNGLEKGDIVLLDEAYPDFDEERVSGEVLLRIGDGSLGGIRTQVTDKPGRLKLRLEDVFRE